MNPSEFILFRDGPWGQQSKRVLTPQHSQRNGRERERVQSSQGVPQQFFISDVAPHAQIKLTYLHFEKRQFITIGSHEMLSLYAVRHLVELRTIHFASNGCILERGPKVSLGYD